MEDHLDVPIETRGPAIRRQCPNPASVAPKRSRRAGPTVEHGGRI
jgi:hypothetical protein